MSNWENNFGTKDFKGFMLKLFDTYPTTKLDFFNRKVTFKQDNKVVEFVLSTRGTSGQYEKIVVSIIHTDNGVIASESFNFSDYLMDGYKAGREGYNPCIISHCGIDWYMNGPTKAAINDLMKAMHKYVSLYI